MNLLRAQQVLLALKRCDERALRIQRTANEAAVREIAGAGLIEATLADGSPGSVTSTGAVTEAGRRFLHAFPLSYRFCEAR
jgi:hypothetical protein